jgi:hypothetical protein
MRCFRCKSSRLVKFIDGFGEKRVFCKNCWGSFLEESVVEFGAQKNLRDFKLIVHQNNRAIR